MRKLIEKEKKRTKEMKRIKAGFKEENRKEGTDAQNTHSIRCRTRTWVIKTMKFPIQYTGLMDALCFCVNIIFVDNFLFEGLY